MEDHVDRQQTSPKPEPQHTVHLRMFRCVELCAFHLLSDSRTSNGGLYFARVVRFIDARVVAEVLGLEKPPTDSDFRKSNSNGRCLSRTRSCKRALHCK